jgi:hypothetical protein
MTFDDSAIHPEVKKSADVFMLQTPLYLIRLLCSDVTRTDKLTVGRQSAAP